MGTKTPNPSAAANSRRSMPPPPTPAAALSPPFSPAPLRPRLGAAATAADSSSPVEKPCVKLWEWWLARVEGEDRKLAVSGYTEKNDAFTSAPIAKRYEPLTLEDEDGVVLLLDGSMSLPRMLENEFSPQVCEVFLLGFPYWWETWNSHMETFPKCFINPREDSSQFYLQKFQLGNFLEKLGPSFIESLRNDAKNNPIDDADTFTDCSRFEEYTCGSDFSIKEISAESNDAIPAPVADEVEETDLIASSPSQQRDNVDIHCNLSFGPTETCSGDETCKETGNQNDTMHPDLIASSPSQQRDNVDIHCNLSFGPTGTCSGDETCKETGNQNDTMHPDARELEAGSHLVNSNLIFSRSPNCMPSDLEDGSASAGNSEDLVSKCLLAAVPPEKANICSEIAGTLQSVEPLCYQSTPVASLKNQACLKRTELITLNQKAEPNGDTSTPVHSDALSLEITVCPAEKQRSAQKLLMTPTRSPMIRSPILYAHHAPLTRARAQSLSISTPESLKMKRTKSGRVVVPALDPGSERIVYDMDGTISGVSPVFQSPLKGCTARKRKRKAL